MTKKEAIEVLKTKSCTDCYGADDAYHCPDCECPVREATHMAIEALTEAISGGNVMKCKDCEYFHIKQEPLPEHYDHGLVECRKYSLVTTFYNHGELNRLVCVEQQEDK